MDQARAKARQLAVDFSSPDYPASKNGEGVLTKKELIKRDTELETPDDRRISVVGLSQSTAYALFDKAKEYEPKADETLADLMRYGRDDRVRGAASQALLDREG